MRGDMLKMQRKANKKLDLGLQGGVVVSTDVHNKRVLRSNTAWSFACSPRVCVGSLRVFWLPPSPKNMHVRLIDSKLSLGVSVSVDGCLSCCVAL